MRIVLHIGPPKTGTTFLQHTLYANRKTLAKRGILFPTGCLYGNNKQHAFLGYLADYNFNSSSKLYGWNDKTHKNKKRYFEQEIAVSDFHTVVLSSEHLFWLNSLQRKKLRKYLSSYCKNLEIIAYVRHPIAWMLSSMSQHVGTGYNLDFDFFSDRHYRSSIPNSLWMNLQGFQEDFGIDAVRVFAYQRDFIEDWNISEHFCTEVLRCEGLETQPAINHTNEHSDAQAAQLIAEMHYLKPRLNHFTGEWLESNYQNVNDFSNQLPQNKNKIYVPANLVSEIEKKSNRILKVYREQWDIKFPKYHYFTKQFNHHRFTKEYIWEMFKKLESAEVTEKRSEEKGQQSDVFLSNEVTKNLALFFYNSIDKRLENNKISEPLNNATAVFERNTVFFREIVHNIFSENDIHPIIYGTGRVCDAILPYLSEHGIDINMFIDQKAEVKFIEKNGLQVHPLSSLGKDCEYNVIVCSYDKFMDMKNEVFEHASQNNIKVTLYTVAGIFRNF